MAKKLDWHDLHTLKLIGQGRDRVFAAISESTYARFDKLGLIIFNGTHWVLTPKGKHLAIGS